MTDTTDLLPASGNDDGFAAAPAEQAPQAAAPRVRRRATSGGLAAMVLPELQAMATGLGISGVGRLRKSQLIEAIQTKQSGGTAAAPAAEAAVQAAPAAAAQDAEPDEQSNDDGERPERVDRGRERFLE
ncbi:MAG: transcription termination factor Rho, partial [Frankiales bacterium]|nr:transcription termination factor Rho [Frankiales bacterium]